MDDPGDGPVTVWKIIFLFSGSVFSLGLELPIWIVGFLLARCSLHHLTFNIG